MNLVITDNGKHETITIPSDRSAYFTAFFAGLVVAWAITLPFLLQGIILN
jgi:hypothetical protein